MTPKTGSFLAIFLLACGGSDGGEPPPAVVPEASVSETVPPASIADAAPPAEQAEAAAPAPAETPPAPQDAGAPPGNSEADLRACISACAIDIKCVFECTRRIRPGGP